MSQQVVLSAFEHGRVYARCARRGRWTWDITLFVPMKGSGLGEYPMSRRTVLSERRARRTAKRMVDKHIKKYTEQKKTIFIPSSAGNI